MTKAPVASERPPPRIGAAIFLDRLSARVLWSEPEISARLCDALGSTGLTDECRTRVETAPSGQFHRARKVLPSAEIAAMLSNSSGSATLELSSGAIRYEGTYVQLSKSPGRLSVAISQFYRPGEATPPLSERAVASIDAVTTALLDFATATTCCAARPDLVAPLVYPPFRRPFRVEPYCVLDARWFARHSPEVYEKARAAPFPASATRVEQPPFLKLRWVTDFGDDDAVREALTLASLWIERVIAPPMDKAYNRYGDEAWVALPMASKPPLSWYDPISASGMRAIVADSPRGPDVEAIADMERWVAEGALPDGTALKSLGVMANTREGAIAIRDRVRAFADGPIVWYDDATSTWWNIDPPGDWVRPGTGRYRRIEALLPPELLERTS